MYKTFKSEQDKMDGQQSNSQTYIRSNAGGAALNYDETFDKEMEWFTDAIDAIHSELKDDMRPADVPHNIAFPNHAQLSEQQKDKVLKLYYTLCTTKSKAKSYNENRTKGNVVEKRGNSDRDGEEKLREFVLKLRDAMVKEVDKWPGIVPYPQDVSSSHIACYDAIQSVYMKAKEVALSNWNSEGMGVSLRVNDAAKITELEKLLKQRDDQLNEFKQRSCEIVRALEKENQNHVARTRQLEEQREHDLREVKLRDSEGMSVRMRKLEEFLKQNEHELGEIKQRNSEGMSAREKENQNIAAKMRDFLRQNEHELNEVIQRDSEGISAKRIRELEELLKQREYELRELKQRESKDMSAKIRELEERLKQREQELREVKHRDSEGMSDKKIRELDERLKQREHELRELKQRAGEGDSASASENRDHDRKISKLQEILRERDNELQEVKLRLSALMGAKLQDGNVNITDLSDTNRPTKIAERFGQLYDDYWTDAFQFQTCNFGRSDEEAIARLLEMLKDAHQFCKKTSQEHTNVVLCELLLCKKSNTQRESTQKPQIKELNEVQRKQLHELRRQTANCTTENLTNMYFGYATNARTFTEHEISHCTQYLELSVELCWYMIIQNPPVHIQFEPPMRGKPFKTGEYKFYSRSGKTFDYVVWPPLRLTEGGDLLAKGVAEPMR